MACSECYSGSTVAIEGGEGVTVTGSGSPGDKYVVSLTRNPFPGDVPTINITADGVLNLSFYTYSVLANVTVNADSTILLPDNIELQARDIILVLTQGGTGGNSIDFAGAGILATAPIVLSTAAGAIDMVVLTWTGSMWIGVLAALDVS